MLVIEDVEILLTIVILYRVTYDVIVNMPKVSIVHKYAKVSNRLLSRSPRTKYNEDSPARRTVAKLQNLYGQNSSAANAVSMEKYMKNKFKFYGLKSPIRRSLDKQVWISLQSLMKYILSFVEKPTEEHFCIANRTGYVFIRRACRKWSLQY